MKLFNRSRFVAFGALSLLTLGSALAAPSAYAQQHVKQSSTSRKLLFLLVQSSDHITPLTGATPTVTISKNGATFTAPTGTVAEVGSGWYALTPSTADTSTLGALVIHWTATNADPGDKEFNIVAYNPDDATLLGLTGIATSATQTSNGTTLTAVKAKTDLITAFPSNFSTLTIGTGSDAGKVVTSNPAVGGSGLTAADVWAYSIGGTAASARLTAVQAKTDQLAFDGSGYVSARVKAVDQAVLDSIAAGVLSSVVDGTITVKQAAAIQLSVAAGNYTVTPINSVTHIQTVTYKKRNGDVLATATVTYNNANTVIDNRSVVFTNLP